MADDGGLARLRDLAGSVGSFVAPVTLISAMLFYFGYVYSRAFYLWFGLDVDTIGLSTQEFIMRSPAPLVVPLLAAGVVGAGVTAVHGAIRRRLVAAADAPWRLRAIRRLATAVSVIGRLLLGAGIVLVLGYRWLGGLVGEYNLFTASVLVIGAALAAYGIELGGLLGRDGRRGAVVALYVVVTAGLLWGTAELAQLIARGEAIRLSANLGTELPAVVLDTKEHLFLVSHGVEERMLAPELDQTFRYRYRNLHLLIQGQDRLFLVPGSWSPTDATLMVALDGSVRVQFPYGVGLR